MFFKPDDRLLALIREAQDIALVTHIYPDGDGLGSEVALADALLSLGKRVKVWNCHGPPTQLGFVDAKGYVEILSKEDAARLPELDLILSVDTAEVSRLGYLRPYFTASRAKKAACDHHILPPNHPFDVAWAEERAGATGILVLDLLEAFGVTPSPLAAVALFVAIASDTGWFSFNNTGPRELAAASRLAELGACPSEIHRRVSGSVPITQITLLGQVLASIRSEFGGKFVWSCIKSEQMSEMGIRYEELDGIVDELKRAQNVSIAALIIGLQNQRWKVSLRGPAECNVDTIARHFGGGGHAKAAGYRIEAEDFDTLMKDLREQVAGVLDAGSKGEAVSSPGPAGTVRPSD